MPTATMLNTLKTISLLQDMVFFKRVITIWFSGEQQTMLMSILKVKYVTIYYKVRTRVWIKRFLNKLFLKQVIWRIEIFNDNKISFILTKDLKSQNCIKNIDVMHYQVQKLIEEEELEIKWISSLSMLANGLIKAFPIEFFMKY